MLSEEDVALINQIMSEDSFPKYQYSVFLKNGRDEQLVIRSNSFEDLMEQKKNINKILEKVEGTPEAPKEAAKTFVCSQCGGPAEYKEGISSKTDKPWRAVFCLKDKTHVKWF